MIKGNSGSNSERLKWVKEYLDGLVEMNRGYRESVGEPMISGFRLKVPKDDRTPENEIYHNAFLPFDLTFKHPEILADPAIEDNELKKIPDHGKFVVAPGKVIERAKPERTTVPQAKGSGCSSALLAVAMVLSLLTFTLSGCQ